MFIIVITPPASPATTACVRTELRDRGVSRVGLCGSPRSRPSRGVCFADSTLKQHGALPESIEIDKNRGCRRPAIGRDQVVFTPPQWAILFNAVTPALKARCHRAGIIGLLGRECRRSVRLLLSNLSPLAPSAKSAHHTAHCGASRRPFARVARDRTSDCSHRCATSCASQNVRA